MFWRLSWNYILEIRNNSSYVAYNIRIKYIHLPDKTFIEGNIGKIEPLLSHEIREFRIKIIQYVTGTYIDADKYLEENVNSLMANFLIEIKYKDENGFPFSTTYDWSNDETKYHIF